MKSSSYLHPDPEYRSKAFPSRPFPSPGSTPLSDAVSPNDRIVPPLPAFDTDPWMYRFPQYRDDNYYQNEMRYIPHKTLEPLFDDQGIIRDDYDDAEWEASLKYAPPDVRNDLINANPKYKLPPFGTYELTPAERARNIGKSLIGAARDFVNPAGVSGKAFNALRGTGEFIGDKIADGMQWAYDKYVDPGNPPANPFRVQSPEDLDATFNDIGNFDLNKYAGY
jgi:hypothetical protein